MAGAVGAPAEGQAGGDRSPALTGGRRTARYAAPHRSTPPPTAAAAAAAGPLLIDGMAFIGLNLVSVFVCVMGAAVLARGGTKAAG